MTEDEKKKKFKTAMLNMFEVYNKEITSSLLLTYWGILKAYKMEDIERAIALHVGDSDAGRFIPKPANLMHHIAGKTRQTEKLIEDKAQIAWAVIMGEIGRVGRYGRLKMEDKQALAAVQALGGWQRLCGSTTEQLTWMKKEFAAIYETYEHADPLSLPDRLPGLIDIQNNKSDSAGGSGTLQQIAARIGKH